LPGKAERPGSQKRVFCGSYVNANKGGVKKSEKRLKNVGEGQSVAKLLV